MDKIKQNKYRTVSCGDLDISYVGKQVRLAGWIHTIRDHGGITFVDLRDQNGLVQLVVNDKLLTGVSRETVIAVQGKVRLRGEENVNPKLATGEVEVVVENLNVLGPVLAPLPFEISESRKNYAQVLSVLIQEKLEKLELPKAKSEISIQQKELSSDGIDNVEFLISTNVSEDLKPLAKVASGGEISRVMLAIKSIFAQSDNINTVIFDEIDTGISGKASQSVADEIAELSKYHQIILITHQPIIASRADKHFYVRKSQCDETKVEVYVLNGENRIKALAELAGGEINEQSIEFARSLVMN